MGIVIVTLLFLLSLAVMLFGLITVIKPFWIIKTRLYAGFVILGGFILFISSIVGMFAVMPDDIKNAAETEEKREEEKKKEEPQKRNEEEEKEAEKPKPAPEPSKPKSLPEISDFEKQMAIDQIKQEPEVKDALIKIKDDKITLVVQLSIPVEKERAQEIGDNFVRMLAAFTDGLDMPTKHYLGELWDHYDLHIGVGTGPDNFIAQGAKVKTGKRIIW